MFGNSKIMNLRNVCELKQCSWIWKYLWVLKEVKVVLKFHEIWNENEFEICSLIVFKEKHKKEKEKNKQTCVKKLKRQNKKK